jgi:hypothetical protein
MNRTFLIFLMVGTALLIAVIGGEHRSALPGYMPWEVKVLDNGNIRVFGINLNRTRIQEANQILSSFPETRLQTDQNNQPALFAVYDQLNMGGLIVRLELQYDVDEETLGQLAARATDSDEGHDATLPDQLEMELLDARVKAIRYLPEIDYDMDMVLQRFGQPAELQSLSDRLQWLRYPDMGLDILLDRAGPEIFSYRAIEKPAAPRPDPAMDIEKNESANERK